VLALPAAPLTASAGYLFGLPIGTAVVLCSGTLAAGIAFLLGRTLLRPRVLSIAENNAKFRALDRAVAKEGFKIVLLLRLSPLLPFALSNYLYGLTAVEFWPYMAGTFFGFLPGTTAYVYTGTASKGLVDASAAGADATSSAVADAAAAVPEWLGPAAVLCGFAVVVQQVSRLASEALEEIEMEEAGK